MTKEEKQQAFFEMLEHPEKYTDEQIRSMLNDPELRQDYDTLAKAKSAITRNEAKSSNNNNVDVDEEWQKFVKAHRRNNWHKIAAAMTVVVIVSGLALAAAVHFTSDSEVIGVKVVGFKDTTTKPLTPNTQHLTLNTYHQSPDTLALRPVTFEDAMLGDILKPMAAFYGAKISVGNSAMLSVRLYFVWDKRKTLQQNIDLLNGFERINLKVDNGNNIIEQ